MAELQDVTKRAPEQHALVFEALMAQLGSLKPPTPVEVDSLFRPGRRLSVTANDGEEMKEPGEVVVDKQA